MAMLAKLDVSSGAEVVVAPRGGTPPDGAVQAVVMPGVEVRLPMAGLFDAEKEIARLNGQREKVAKEADGLRGRLSNKKFVDKAPANVVAEAQGQLAELDGKLAAIDEKIQSMKALQK